jgi:hypothetical protein
MTEQRDWLYYFVYGVLALPGFAIALFWCFWAMRGSRDWRERQ